MSIDALRRYAESGIESTISQDSDAADELFALLGAKTGAYEDDLRDALSDDVYDRDAARAIVALFDYLDSQPDADATETTLSAIELSQVIGLVRANNPIAAIKQLREATGWGLRQAKDIIDVLLAAFRVETRVQAGSLAGIGLTPSIINELRRRRGPDAAFIPTSSDEDRALVAALLDDPRFRAALFAFGNDAFGEARRLVSGVVGGDVLSGVDVPVLLRAYDDASDPERASKRRRLDDLARERARIEAEYSELEAELQS